jgi:hypothetical protein
MCRLACSPGRPMPLGHRWPRERTGATNRDNGKACAVRGLRLDAQQPDIAGCAQRRVPHSLRFTHLRHGLLHPPARRDRRDPASQGGERFGRLTPLRKGAEQVSGPDKQRSSPAAGCNSPTSRAVLRRTSSRGLARRYRSGPDPPEAQRSRPEPGRIPVDGLCRCAVLSRSQCSLLVGSGAGAATPNGRDHGDFNQYRHDPSAGRGVPKGSLCGALLL